MVESFRAAPLLVSPAQHAEGPFWIEREQRLGWVDITAGALHRVRPDGSDDRVLEVGQPLGAAVPRRDGGFALAVESGFALLDEGAREPRMVAEVDSHRGSVRMNDGKCDPAGRFWAGTMAYDVAPHAGALYRLDADMRVTQVLRDVTISNGLDWSDDSRTMYYVDSMAGVDVLDYDATSGAVSGRRRLVTIPSDTTSPAGFTVPDGMTLDAEGHLWVAVFGAGEVHRYDPAGRLVAVVSVDAIAPTSCAFGGPDLDTLYVTASASHHGEATAAVVIYRVRPGTRGRPPFAFAG